MLYDWMVRPIPPAPPEGPKVIPQECGEPAVDATHLHPRIHFLASDRARGSLQRHAAYGCAGLWLNGSAVLPRSWMQG